MNVVEESFDSDDLGIDFGINYSVNGGIVDDDSVGVLKNGDESIDNDEDSSISDDSFQLEVDNFMECVASYFDGKKYKDYIFEDNFLNEAFDKKDEEFRKSVLDSVEMHFPRRMDYVQVGLMQNDDELSWFDDLISVNSMNSICTFDTRVTWERKYDEERNENIVEYISFRLNFPEH